jgi:hypothetical protein
VAGEHEGAGSELDLVGQELDLAIVVRESARGHESPDLGRHSELFLQLPRQAFLGCLARLDLAAGKLPESP